MARQGAGGQGPEVNDQSERRRANSKEQKAEVMRTCEHIESNRGSISQRSMLRMTAPNGYEIFRGVEGVDVKKHGRDLIASRLAPALLSAVRGYGKAGHWRSSPTRRLVPKRSSSQRRRSTSVSRVNKS